MRTCAAFVVSALCVVMVVTPAYAQQPGASPDPHHPAPPAGSAPVAPPAATPGMQGGGMPMMDMCRQMMAEMMGMPMMGGTTPADPKEKAAMLEMRGEMMKAMGDIMMKHGRRMQGMPGRPGR
jgi:hypothetical protein